MERAALPDAAQGRADEKRGGEHAALRARAEGRAREVAEYREWIERYTPKRFREREAHPLKQWKLSPIDMASLDKWDDYTKAKEAMFFETDTADAPWTVIKSDCKKRARLNAMRFVLNRLPYAERKPERVGAVDPLIVGRPALVSVAGDDLLAPGGGG